MSAPTVIRSHLRWEESQSSLQELALAPPVPLSLASSTPVALAPAGSRTPEHCPTSDSFFCPQPPAHPSLFTCWLHVTPSEHPTQSHPPQPPLPFPAFFPSHLTPWHFVCLFFIPWLCLQPPFEWELHEVRDFIHSCVLSTSDTVWHVGGTP